MICRRLNLVVHVAAYAVCVYLSTTTLMGCAIAQKPDGTFVLGLPMTGDGTTASGAGAAVGGILGSLGVPGATLIGGGVTTLLALAGVGIHKSGKESGWDESAATRATPTPPPKLPPTAVFSSSSNPMATVVSVTPPSTGVSL